MVHLLKNEVKGKKILPDGKNYYYIQKRYSKYYYCNRCNDLIGTFYKNNWRCRQPQYTPLKTVTREKEYWDIDGLWDGKCWVCSLDLGEDPERWSSRWKRQQKKCYCCDKLSNHWTPHHISYFPEIIVNVCGDCHKTIHFAYRHYLKPPIADGKLFYKYNYRYDMEGERFYKINPKGGNHG